MGVDREIVADGLAGKGRHQRDRIVETGFVQSLVEAALGNPVIARAWIGPYCCGVLTTGAVFAHQRLAVGGKDHPSAAVGAGEAPGAGLCGGNRERGLCGPQVVGVDNLAGVQPALQDGQPAAGARIGLPVVVRPAYTMGGTGGGFAYNVEELEQIVAPIVTGIPTEILHEEAFAH